MSHGIYKQRNKSDSSKSEDGGKRPAHKAADRKPKHRLQSDMFAPNRFIAHNQAAY